jgi:hypothetical protein
LPEAEPAVERTARRSRRASSKQGPPSVEG